jgi:hypothetical protein
MPENNTPNLDIQLITDDERTPVEIGSAVFQIRRLPHLKEREIRLRCMPKSRKPTLAEERMAADAVADGIFEYVLVGWSGVNWPNGEPAEFSIENARRLPQGVKLQIMARMHGFSTKQRQAEEEEGND